MAVTSPASEQSVTSSLLQTSPALYSIFQKNAIPFLKFFSKFSNFLFRVRFSVRLKKLICHMVFSTRLTTGFFHDLLPLVRAYHIAHLNPLFRACHQTFIRCMNFIHVSDTSFFQHVAHIHPYFYPLILYKPDHLLLRFNTLKQFLPFFRRSDVRPFFRFSAPPIPPAARLCPSTPPQQAKTGRLLFRGADSLFGVILFYLFSIVT